VERYSLAAEFGLKLRAEQTLAPLSDGEALRQAREVVEEEGRLPNTRRLRELGYPKLSSYIERQGGSSRFAAKHGLPARPHTRQAPRAGPQ
jgi:hypothetical protein